jgi:hypothetical protein
MNVRRSAVFAAIVVFGTIVAPAMSIDELKAANACRALVVDPSSAVNLRRPFALRYRTAPLRLCMPDDTNTFMTVAFA